MTIYQLHFLDKVPEYAAVNEAVNMTKNISQGAAKLVNGILRNYLRSKDNLGIVFFDYMDELCYKYSFERWMVKLLINQYGEKRIEQILEGLNKVPSVTARVNTVLSDYDSVWNKLKELNYDIEEGFICPEAIKIIKGKNIEDNELFRDGLITVQDESAMLVAPSMDLEEGLTVLDLCSAPGGKATHIGEIMNNKGVVKAYDIHEGKLQLIEENYKRLKLTNIECDVQDASQVSDTLVESADRVLIDVPCSGLGIVRKKPEIKWNKSVKELREIQEIQRRIITNAASYVKVGGVLLYSTCTLNRDENENVVDWFVKNKENYELEKLSFGEADNLIYNDNGTVTILPNESMDGFFIAKIRRLR
jgi:16S rRNA (cytosine967-C5)-methyltransferase